MECNPYEFWLDRIGAEAGQRLGPGGVDFYLREGFYVDDGKAKYKKAFLGDWIAREDRAIALLDKGWSSDDAKTFSSLMGGESLINDEIIGQMELWSTALQS